jgi:hypothetical protein
MIDETEDREIALARIKYDHDLAMEGLRGTLWGAWAALFAIVFIASIQIIYDRYVIRDWAFFGMVAIISISIMLYGAYIFNQAFQLTTRYGSLDVKPKFPDQG